MKPVILIGGGGHARVLIGMLKRLNVAILGLVDPGQPKGEECFGISILGHDDEILKYSPDQIELVNGLGSLPGYSGLRPMLFQRFRDQGYSFRTVCDPWAFIADDVDLAEGVQVMAGGIIQAGTKIAENSIINSGAIVEHDCRIGKHVHIAPGAVLSGGISVGDNVHIGTGARIIQSLRIGKNSIVGAGSVVTCNVGSHHIVYPARSLIKELPKD